MSRTQEESITCYCENVISITVPAEIDLDQSPGTVNEIIEGEFQKVTCDRCGKELKPEFGVRIRSASGNMDLKYLPELQREGFYKGDIDPEGASELVIGYKELREYFLMRNLGLKRFPVEAVKLNLLQRASQSFGVEILLSDLEEERLVFNLFGLREDEVGVIRVPLSVYEGFLKQEKSLTEQEEYAALIRGPYLSINLVSFVEDEE